MAHYGDILTMLTQIWAPVHQFSHKTHEIRVTQEIFLAHLLLHMILGIIYPAKLLLFFTLGVIWEVIEYLIGAFSSDNWWGGSVWAHTQDIIANTLGFLLGILISKMLCDHSPPTIGGK